MTNPGGIDEPYSESRYCFNFSNSSSERRTFLSRATVVVHYVLQILKPFDINTRSLVNHLKTIVFREQFHHVVVSFVGVLEFE
jgi:hypothetical protein